MDKANLWALQNEASRDEWQLTIDDNRAMNHLKRDVVPVILVSNEEFWLPYTLMAIKDWFHRYIIYDVGSTDHTREIIRWFIEQSNRKERPPYYEVRYRELPMCSTDVQGTFRNALIAEAESDWYFIVDGDEVWPHKSLLAMAYQLPNLQSAFANRGALYGVVRRMEVTHDLSQVHGRDEFVKHHRLYHRLATWTGPHPGEDPRHAQKEANEHYFKDDVFMYHFHQPARSSMDTVVPGRTGRRYKPTYVRGGLSKLDLLVELPNLAKPWCDWPVNPYLKALQEAANRER